MKLFLDLLAYFFIAISALLAAKLPEAGKEYPVSFQLLLGCRELRRRTVLDPIGGQCIVDRCVVRQGAVMCPTTFAIGRDWTVFQVAAN